MHIENSYLEYYQKEKDFVYIKDRTDTNVLNSICAEHSLRVEIVKLLSFLLRNLNLSRLH